MALAGCTPAQVDVHVVHAPNGAALGEIDGVFPPGSRFIRLELGMSEREVETLIGRPQDIDARMTGRQFIPLYFDDDSSRTVAYYRGQGRLEFADRSLDGYARTLVRIVNDPGERGASRR